MLLHQFNTNPTHYPYIEKFTIIDMKICSIIPALSWYSWAYVVARAHQAAEGGERACNIHRRQNAECY